MLALRQRCEQGGVLAVRQGSGILDLHQQVAQALGVVLEFLVAPALIQVVVVEAEGGGGGLKFLLWVGHGNLLMGWLRWRKENGRQPDLNQPRVSLTDINGGHASGPGWRQA
jgi:hypothetical protein